MHPTGAPIPLDTLHGVLWMVDQVSLGFAPTVPGLAGVSNNLHQIIARLEAALDGSNAAGGGDRVCIAVMDAIGHPAYREGVAVTDA